MTTDQADDLGDKRLALTFAQHIVRLQTVFEQAMAPALAARELTAAELDVLAALYSVGTPFQLRPKELSARLLLTAGGVSNVLRRLDARGLISRVPDPSDRRSHNVQLTPEGATIARITTTAATAAFQRVLATVPASTLEETLHQLREILAAIDDTRLGPPFQPLL